MAVANLLLSVSTTILLPTMPLWMLYTEGLSEAEVAVAMSCFGLGLFVPGCFCSYLVQRYRRNVVCLVAIVALAVSLVLCLWEPCRMLSYGWICLLRLVQGACFGLSQMVLTSTLIIDTCESGRRTEANHSATWFGRFALSIGPMAGLLLYELSGFRLVSLVAAGCAVASAVLIMLVRFPFRVPGDDVRPVSLDRFLLAHGLPLFFCLLLIMIGVGMLLSQPLDASFYALLMVGFLLALLAQRFVFRDAELESEVLSGLLLMLASVLIMIAAPHSPLLSPLLGLGLGLVGSRFLLFFIKLSRHCQRGTSQSTFMLAWEGGIAFGLGLGYAMTESAEQRLHVVLALFAVLLLCYHFFLHPWFLRNKNR